MRIFTTFRVSAATWIVSAGLVGSALGLVGVGLRTAVGRDAVIRLGIALLNDALEGTAEIGSVTGGLTDGFVARDVVIRGTTGVVLARLPEVGVRYGPWDLIGRVTLGQVTLRDPEIFLVRPPGGRFNYQEVLRLGGPAGPDDGGRPPHVAFRRVEIDNARVEIRTPHDDSADAAVRVRRVDSLTARLSYARLSSPFEGEKAIRFDVEALRATVSDPALAIRDLAGRLEIDGDSMAVDLERLVLPGGDARVVGSLSWEGGPLRLALDVDARGFALTDVRGLVDGLPWGLVGEGQVSLRSVGDDRLRVTANPLRLQAPRGGGRVAGRFGIEVGPDSWRLFDTRLRLEALSLDYLRPMVDTIPLAGRLTGTVDARGHRDSLYLDATVAFQDALVAAAGLSDLVGRGGVWLREGGFGFAGFTLSDTRLDLATVRRLFPAVGLDGALALSGTVDGPWENLLFRGDLTHRTVQYPPSTARGTVQLDTRSDLLGLFADVAIDSVAWPGLHASYPALPAYGRMGGDLFLTGRVDSLSFRTQLAGTAGRVAANGVLQLTADTVGVRGLSARVDDLDLRQLVADAPPSDIRGAVSGTVQRVDGAVTGALEVGIDTSSVGGSPVDRVAARFDFGHRVVGIERLEIAAPLTRVRAAGRLGLDETRQDTLRIDLDLDSLGVIEGLLRDRFPAWNQDSALTAIRGSASSRVTIAGSVPAHHVAWDLDIPAAASTAAALEGVRLRARWSNAPDGRLSLHGAVDSIVRGHMDFTDVSLDIEGQRDRSTWFARARLGRDGSWLARGAIQVDSTGTTLPIDFMGLLLPTHRWFVDSGAVITVEPDGYRLAGVRLESEAGEAWVELDGVLPRAGGQGRLRGSMVALPVSDVWGLAQRETERVGGRLGGQLTLGGTARDPVWEAWVDLDQARFGELRVPQFQGEVRYEARRLRGNGSLWRPGERILQLELDLPLDLALEGASQRQLPGPLSITARADGVDLAFMEFVTPAVQSASGQLHADLGITGTWEDPRLTGTAEITGGQGYFPALGVAHRDIEGRFVLRGDTIGVDYLRLTAGTGRATVSGHVRLEELTEPIVRLDVDTDRFRMIDVPDFLALTMSGRIAADGPLFGMVVTGAGTATDGDLYVANLLEKRIVNLEDTLYAALIAPELRREASLRQTFENRLLDSLRVDNFALTMGSNVRLLSTEANVQLAGQVVVSKETDRYRIDGRLDTPRGVYRLPLGRGVTSGLIVREFTVTGGSVQYFGTPDLNAGVDINARHVVRTTRGDNITVFVHVGGTLYTPQLTLSSDVRPALPQDEIISYLLFSAPSIEAFSGRTVGEAVLAPLGDAFSLGLERSLVTDLGLPIDYLRIRPTTQGLSATEIALGWQLTERSFLTVSPRLCPQEQLSNNIGASLEYRLSPNWRLAASNDPVNACTLTGGSSRNRKSQLGFDLFWEKRY